MTLNTILDLVQNILSWAGASIKGQEIFASIVQWISSVFGA